MSLTLEALAVVDAIARRGSFAAAASELGKVPSALTYTVRRLEDELDVLLFDRRGNRARLTAAGLELLEQGRQLLRAADDLACRVREVASGWEVELRIAVDTVVSFDRIRPMIEDFCTSGSPTRLRFGHEVLDGGWDALLAGRADLAIGVGHDAPAQAFDAGEFSMRPLGEVRFVYCMAPHHPLAGTPDPLTDEVLMRHRAVAIGNTARTLPGRSSGLLSGQETITVATLGHKIALLIAGVGAGYLPEAFARPHLEAGRLVASAVAHPQPPTAVRYAWRRAARGKALAWWLARLEADRTREQLLAGPLSMRFGTPAPGSAGAPPTSPTKPSPGTARKRATRAGSGAQRAAGRRGSGR
jgi:DNA-binding transcriptional LysR family regulator